MTSKEIQPAFVAEGSPLERFELCSGYAVKPRPQRILEALEKLPPDLLHRAGRGPSPAL